MLQIKAGRIIVNDGTAISNPTKGYLAIEPSVNCTILSWRPREEGQENDDEEKLKRENEKTVSLSSTRSFSLVRNNISNSENDSFFSLLKKEEWIFTPGDARIDILKEETKKEEKQENIKNEIKNHQEKKSKNENHQEIKNEFADLIFVLSALNNVKLYFWSQEPNPLVSKKWIIHANTNHLLRDPKLAFQELFQPLLLCNLIEKHEKEPLQSIENIFPLSSSFPPSSSQEEIKKNLKNKNFNKKDLIEMFESAPFRQAIDFLERGIESDLFPILMANFQLEETMNDSNYSNGLDDSNGLNSFDISHNHNRVKDTPVASFLSKNENVNDNFHPHPHSSHSPSFLTRIFLRAIKEKIAKKENGAKNLPKMTLDPNADSDNHLVHQNLPPLSTNSTPISKNTNQQAGLLTDSEDDDDDIMIDEEMQSNHGKYLHSHQSMIIGGNSSLVDSNHHLHHHHHDIELEGKMRTNGIVIGSVGIGGVELATASTMVTPSSMERKSGRRKIRIEYIEEKGRRHITFSKRKAGIMKKAYELSTLTGTQVLLLVASETGHVYTFATPKLQPLITKPEGKNLIQACLNSPDTTAIMNEMGFDDCEGQSTSSMASQQQQHNLNPNEYCVMAGGRMVGGMVSAPLASTSNTVSNGRSSIHHSVINGGGVGMGMGGSSQSSVSVPSGMISSPYYNSAFSHPSGMGVGGMVGVGSTSNGMTGNGNGGGMNNNGAAGNSYAMAANYWQHQTSSSVSNVQSTNSSGNVNIGHANNAK